MTISKAFLCKNSSHIFSPNKNPDPHEFNAHPSIGFASSECGSDQIKSIMLPSYGGSQNQSISLMSSIKSIVGESPP